VEIVRILLYFQEERMV